MEVVAGMSDRLPLSETAAYARRVEAMGYDTLHVPETVHDGLAVALLAIEHTERLRVRTSVTLAFPRSPMLVAYTAWDLVTLSGGRFDLGLGPQIRQNIEGRYSVEWREPVGRLREYIESLRTIWACFDSGEPLLYEGDHYHFDRLQPFFNPGSNGHPAPAISLGGVNEKMCHLGGSHADSFVTHPTNSSPRYLRELCLPALAAGAESAGRSAGDIHLVTGTPFVSGADAAAVAQSREHHRHIMAFLYTTPAYRRSLELHGWGELGERLQRMTREQAWDQLSALVTDEVIATLLPEATWDDLPQVIHDWYGELVDGVVLPVPPDPADDARFAEVVRAVAALP